MKEFSVLIGGKAGDGIKQAGIMAAKIFGELGYRVFLYDDYPSLIRGGHNFCIIRASKEEVLSHNNQVDLILALNRETIERHQHRLKKGGEIIYSSRIEGVSRGVGIGFEEIVKELGGIPIMKNSAAIGALSALLGIERQVLDGVFEKNINKQLDLNKEIAGRAYAEIKEVLFKVERLDSEPLPLFTGNEAIALGAVNAGLDLYIAYPMTPATSILHFLAEQQDRLGVVTVHPENEISVATMALGAAYAGARTMVGTSGGGFALMTETVSFAGQAEIPILFVECQRAGPGTGVPTYTMQADLLFVLNSGHGDFPRLVVAPGDAEEAFYLSGLALDAAWHFQIPAFLLSDKHLSESIFSFTYPEGEREKPPMVAWKGGEGQYKRYAFTESGISPLAFPGQKGCIVKATSYEHDEYGITTEEPEKIMKMQDKRLKKKEGLVHFLEKTEQVKVYGDRDSKTCLVCWGSTKGACVEAALELGLKVVQPLVVEPFPERQFRQALGSSNRLIGVEVNATGQLSRLLSSYGIHMDSTILRYDSLPFTPDDLKGRLKEATS